MNENISEERLNDYVDGLLPEADAAEVERLLASSVEARATVEFLRSLRTQAGQLPQSLQPERDLWPEIRSRMAPAPLASVEGGVAAPSGASWWPRLDGMQWAALAAAAMFLMVTSSAITAWVIGAPTPGAPPDAATPVAVSLEDVPIGAAEYAVEIEQLLSALYENRDTLDPDTVSTIDTNLRVINRAIRRAREALDEDPQHGGLNRMLSSNYRRKLELLQRANRMIELS